GAHSCLLPGRRLVRVRTRGDEQTTRRLSRSGEQIRPAQCRLFLRTREPRWWTDVTTPRRNPRLALAPFASPSHLLRTAQVLRRSALRDQQAVADVPPDPSRRIEFRPPRLLFLRRQI